MRRRRYAPIVGEGLVSVVDEEDVFGLEVGVYKVQVMQNCTSVSTKS